MVAKFSVAGETPGRKGGAEGASPDSIRTKLSGKRTVSLLLWRDSGLLLGHRRG